MVKTQSIMEFYPVRAGLSRGMNILFMFFFSFIRGVGIGEAIDNINFLLIRILIINSTPSIPSSLMSDFLSLLC